MQPVKLFIIFRSLIFFQLILIQIKRNVCRKGALQSTVFCTRFAFTLFIIVRLRSLPVFFWAAFILRLIGVLIIVTRCSHFNHFRSVHSLSLVFSLVHLHPAHLQPTSSSFSPLYLYLSIVHSASLPPSFVFRPDTLFIVPTGPLSSDSAHDHFVCSFW